jgi:hypothetical protein
MDRISPFGLCVLLAIGCANVIGAGDYQVGATGGGGPAPGAGGSLGTGGKGGAGGVAGGGLAGGGLAGGGLAGGFGGFGIGGFGGFGGFGGAAGGPASSGDSVCGSILPCAGGLTCAMNPVSISTTGVCVEPCTASCPSGQQCITLDPPGCMRDCGSATCSLLMDCVAVGTAPEIYKVCAPKDWYPRGGLGDVCRANAQCNSGNCTGDAVNPGWCTDACDLDPTCAGGYGSTGWENPFGEYNWCVQNTAGADVCTPACFFASSCDNYPGSTCVTKTTTTGYTEDVCVK